ncbi:GrpB family protein [Nonomuraea mesophila]|uniref:GrpB family protein n=1 Tax=Nonomuraea mesophila TaxID=2530382 RepID=A0A4R5FPR5_9ACTN|nr:GrpB family protein [Nonomuraea mesophila]TDE54681.1 GrpB family protein [Nonomuraea mesophila]
MTIVIVDYDAAWPSLAEQACEELLVALPGVFLEIEHVGSTSVPGLAAKPIIDLMASVPALEAVSDRERALTGLGYHGEETGMRERLFYFRADASGRRSHHLHVVRADTWDTRNERLLRDHLRAHPRAASEYAALKRHLAGDDVDVAAYTRAKTELIQRLVDEARQARGLPLVPVWEE